MIRIRIERLSQMKGIALILGKVDVALLTP